MPDTITIDDVEHEILHSLDLGQRNVEETYIDPIIALSQTIRGRSDCDSCRSFLLALAEQDLALLRDADSDYWMEEASSTLEAWERRASDYGLIGYADEGMYWIAAQL